MRAPRRKFATPFVLTLALPLGACVAETTTRSGPNPPQPQPQPVEAKHDPVVVANPPPPHQDPPPEPTRPTVNPPMPRPEPEPEPRRPPILNPPRPQPVDNNTASFDQHWTVEKTGAGCTSFYNDACHSDRKPGAPIPTCNPPAPKPYKCPEDLADGASLKIVKRANQTQCTVDAPVFKCPPNAKCNPPRPRVVDCP